MVYFWMQIDVFILLDEKPKIFQNISSTKRVTKLFVIYSNIWFEHKKLFVIYSNIRFEHKRRYHRMGKRDNIIQRMFKHNYKISF